MKNKRVEALLISVGILAGVVAILLAPAKKGRDTYHNVIISKDYKKLEKELR